MKSVDYFEQMSTFQKIFIKCPEDVISIIGKEIGPSDWLTIDQTMVNQFAQLTGDHQWLHIDPEKSKKESPYGQTIIHGFFLVSLIPTFTDLLLETDKIQLINCGLDRVRFYHPVHVGTQVRAYLTYKSANHIGDALRIELKVALEKELKKEKALEAKLIYLTYFDKRTKQK